MLNESELYLRMRNGDVRAFDVLYERYERSLFGFIVNRVGREKGEEIFQEVFMKLLNSGELTLERGGLKAWLFSVARNLCLNHLSQTQLRARIERDRLIPTKALEESQDDSDQLLTDQQQLVALKDAVNELPNSLAKVYHLRCAGLSYAEISKQLRIPLGTVKSRMNQLTTQLKHSMSVWREA